MSLLQTPASVVTLPFSALGFPGAISIPAETPRYTGEIYELSHVLPKLPMYNSLRGINLGVRLNYCLWGVKLLASTQFSTMLLLMKSSYSHVASILPSGRIITLPDTLYAIDAGQYERSVDRTAFTNSPGARRMCLGGGRPKVRGTVKNPNDHPHGGRTRSISYPVTP